MAIKCQCFVGKVHGKDKDWEVVHFPVPSLSLEAHELEAKKKSSRYQTYRKAISQGAVFPPIKIDEKGFVLDGVHRTLLYEELGRKTIPSMKAIGDGSGKIVKDEVYGKMKGKFACPYDRYFEPEFQPRSYPVCFICKRTLSAQINTGSPTPGFPLGMPKPPFFFCPRCGIIIEKGFLLWQ